MPHPLPHTYSGHRRVRIDNVGTRWSEPAGTSADGATYHYNELGFRGPGFQPDAKWVAFIFGESDAFGEGVDFEEIWAVRVARDIARQRGLARHETCIMNFADAGASNAHIARMVITQCGRVSPDLALVNLAEEGRMEGWMNGEAFAVGPWFRSAATEAEIERAPDSDTHKGNRKAQLRERLERGRAFLRYSDRPQSILDSLRDILLVQNTLRAARIESYAITRQLNRLFRRETVDDPIMGPLAGQIDASFLASFHPLRLRRRNDWRGTHYGPRTHAAVAQRMLTHIDDRSSTTSTWSAALAQ